MSYRNLFSVQTFVNALGSYKKRLYNIPGLSNSIDISVALLLFPNRVYLIQLYSVVVDISCLILPISLEGNSTLQAKSIKLKLCINILHIQAVIRQDR